MAAIWFANVVRIVVLILIGDEFSSSLAFGGFHSQAGWILFNAVAIGTAVVAHRSRLFARRQPAPSGVPSSPTIAYLLPLLAAIAVQMLAEAFVPEPIVLYPARVAVVTILLCVFWNRYRFGPVDRIVVDAFFAMAAGAAVYLLYLAIAPEFAAREAVILPESIAGVSSGIVFAWVVMRMVGFVIVTPLVEELAFRGYLMRRLVAADFESVSFRTFTWPSFLVSSTLFGVAHGDWLVGTLAGVGFALVAYATGRFWPIVLAHATTNALLLL
jgi:exosortase E/protease (VPEID-CTERM system)